MQIGHTFEVPSPLIRALIIHVVVNNQAPKMELPSTLPFTHDTLDVNTLLSLGVKYFDRKSMTEATKWAYKKNECPGGDVPLDKPVPHEKCYHLELLTFLRRVCSLIFSNILLTIAVVAPQLLEACY